MAANLSAVSSKRATTNHFMSAPTWVIVPVSTIGCGKLTLFRALTRIHPQFAHIENDRCEDKKAFLKSINTAIASHPVVLIDRNNHMKRHREELFQALGKENVRFLVVSFVNPNMPYSSIKSIVLERLRARGDNHPSVDGLNEKMLRMVVGLFFRDYTPYNAREEDPLSENMVMSLDMTKDIAWNLKVLLRFFLEHLGLSLPNDERIANEVAAVKRYRVPEEEKKFQRPKVTIREGNPINTQNPIKMQKLKNKRTRRSRRPKATKAVENGV